MKTKLITYLLLMFLLMLLGTQIFTQTPAQSTFQLKPQLFDLTPPGEHLNSKIQQHDYLHSLLNTHAESRFALQRKMASSQPVKTGHDLRTFVEKQKQTGDLTFLIQESPANENILHFRGDDTTLDSSYQYLSTPSALDMPDAKIYYLYDEDGRLTEMKKQIRADDVFQNFELTEYAYDMDGHLTDVAYHFWNDDWHLRKATLYTYDENGRLQQQTTENPNSPWQDESLDFVYAGSFNQPDTILVLRKVNGVNYELHQLKAFELNGHGLPVVKTVFLKFYTGEMVAVERMLFQYDNNLNLLEELTQFRCYESLGDWADHLKTSYVYNASGSLFTATTYSWLASESIWRETFFLVNDYNTDNNLLSQTHHRRAPEGDKSWIERRYETRSYDAAGKLMKEQYHQWDATGNSWKVTEQTNYGYNNQNQLQERITMISECADELYNSFKTTYSYDDMGTANDLKEYEWDLDANSWQLQKSVLRNLSYDGAGKVTEEVILTWVAGSSSYSHILYAYTETGLLAEQIHEYGSPGNWQPGYKFTYTFNQSGQVIEEAGHYWTPSGWVNNTKTTYHYSEQGFLLNETYEYLNGSTWTGISRWKYDYYNNGLLMQETFQTFKNNAWVNNNRFNYEYDENGNNTDFTVAYFNISSGSWQYSTKATRDFDEQNLETLYNSYWWNIQMNDWEANLRVHTTYDNSTQQPTERLTENFEFTNFVWAANLHTDHFWSGSITSSRDELASLLDCRLANPYSNGNLISCDGADGQIATLSVYDMLGRLRLEQTFTGQTTLNRPLEAGSYYFLIKNEQGEVYGRKVILY